MADDRQKENMTRSDDVSAEALDLMQRLLLVMPRLSTDASVGGLRARLESGLPSAELYLLLIAPTDVIPQLVPELFNFVTSQRYTVLVRGIFGRLPFKTRQEILQSQILPCLSSADDEVYRRVAELLYHLGHRDELHQLVRMALDSTDEHIREVGEDFEGV